MGSNYGMILVVFFFILVISGCSAPDSIVGSDGGKINVVVSILPLADFVEKIGGDRVDVTVMVPPRASLATYEPTPGQMKALTFAGMHVKVGSGILFEDNWMDDFGNDKIIVVDGCRGIEVIDNDPHVWLSIGNVKMIVGNIYEGLALADPDNEEIYLLNYKNYVAELDMLDMQIQNQFHGVDDRTFMVFHPAWGYFARDYKLVQIPIEIEGKEPSSADVLGLIKFAKESGLTVIFAQPGSNMEMAEVIGKEAGAEIVIADPLARDYVGNMQAVSKVFADSMK